MEIFKHIQQCQRSQVITNRMNQQPVIKVNYVHCPTLYTDYWLLLAFNLSRYFSSFQKNNNKTSIYF